MGQYFKTADEFTGIFKDLLDKILNDPELSKTIQSLNKTITFKFTDFDQSITVDSSNLTQPITMDEGMGTGEIKASMTSDVAHKLLLGKSSPLSAIMAQEVQIAGPIYVMNDVIKMFSATSRLYSEVLAAHDKKESGS